MTKSLHVVQIGYDENVFREEAPSDTLRRQLWYGGILAQKRPGSSMTYIVLTRARHYKPFRQENVEFVPVAGGKFGQLLRLWSTLLQMHAENPIDVLSPQDVHEQGWVALLFGKLFGVPVVGQIHYDIFSPLAQADTMGKGIVGKFRKYLTFLSLPKYKGMRVVGRSIQQKLAMQGLSQNAQVIPVPVTMLERSSFETAPVAVCPPKVVFVGHLYYPKNLPLWLDVARIVCDKHPDVEFEIVGEGPLAQELKRQAGQLGLAQRVHFKGALAYAELPAVYRSASLFLLTSFYEGFGRVVVEAHAHGLPVVAPRITGVEDIIEDGKTGFLCEPGNAVEMADRVLQLINQVGMGREMGYAGLKRVSRLFNPQKMAETWVEYLVSVVPPPSITIPALRATWRRWWEQSSTKYSMLRGLEYESIKGLRLNGRTLDVGGGKKNSYHHLLMIDGCVESVNISHDIKPSIICDLNHPLPIRSGVYDNFISLNTFEHIEKDEVSICEAFRVLKPGGSFHIIVPFLYRVHGSPSDYHRHTAFWWHSYIKSLGVESGNIVIAPLVWDPESSGFALVEFNYPLRALLKKLVMLPAVLRHVRWLKQIRLPHGRAADGYADYALGYYIFGKK